MFLASVLQVVGGDPVEGVSAFYCYCNKEHIYRLKKKKVILQFWKSEVQTAAAELSVRLLEEPGQSPHPCFPSCQMLSASTGLWTHRCDFCFHRDLFDPEPPACFRRTLVNEPTWIVSPYRDSSAKSIRGHGKVRAFDWWESGWGGGS